MAFNGTSEDALLLAEVVRCMSRPSAFAFLGLLYRVPPEVRPFACGLVGREGPAVSEAEVLLVRGFLLLVAGASPESLLRLRELNAGFLD